MNSEIERVARAIYKASTPADSRWELVDPHYQETVWKPRAEAAIAAMPSQSLLAQAQEREEALRKALADTHNDRAQAQEALRFYATEWDQDVDAERTPSGWEGSIGEVCPTDSLCKDAGAKARAALQPNAGEGR